MVQVQGLTRGRRHEHLLFIGHRNTPDTVLPALIQEVERHIAEYGVTDFVVGHYGHFDTLAAQAVMDAKKRHPSVTLTMLLPYHPAERPIPAPEGYDGTFYPPDMGRVPRRLAIVRANHWMLCRNASQFETHFCYRAAMTSSSLSRMSFAAQNC